jgi:hypothetical protein
VISTVRTAAIRTSKMDAAERLGGGAARMKTAFGGGDLDCRRMSGYIFDEERRKSAS